MSMLRKSELYSSLASERPFFKPPPNMKEHNKHPIIIAIPTLLYLLTNVLSSPELIVMNE